MTRFLSFALPLLVVLIALFNLGVELLGLDPELGPLVGWTDDRRDLSGAYVLGSWILEALGLTALYLLVTDRERSPWLSGLMTGWIAWVFRGPLLVMTAVGFGGLAGGPWWNLTLRWLLLYTLAGLLLAALARATRLEERTGDGEEAAAGAAPPSAAPRPRTGPPPGGPAAAPAPSAPPVGAGPQPPETAGTAAGAPEAGPGEAPPAPRRPAAPPPYRPGPAEDRRPAAQQEGGPQPGPGPVETRQDEPERRKAADAAPATPGPGAAGGRPGHGGADDQPDAPTHTDAEEETP